MTDMSVDYSPEGVFTTFKGDDKGAAPVLTKMDLTFSRDGNNDKRNNG